MLRMFAQHSSPCACVTMAHAEHRRQKQHACSRRITNKRVADASPERSASHLKSCGACAQVAGLDSWLSDAQRADLLAFAALAEACLEPATLYTTWVEQHSYSSHTAVCPQRFVRITSIKALHVSPYLCATLCACVVLNLTATLSGPSSWLNCDAERVMSQLWSFVVLARARLSCKQRPLNSRGLERHGKAACWVHDILDWHLLEAHRSVGS